MMLGEEAVERGRHPLLAPAVVWYETRARDGSGWYAGPVAGIAAQGPFETRAQAVAAAAAQNGAAGRALEEESACTAV